MGLTDFDNHLNSFIISTLKIYIEAKENIVNYQFKT